MTVSTTDRRVTFAGDDTSTDFDVGFPIFDEDHVRAWDHDDTAGTVSELTKDVHFTIALDSDAPSTFNIDITLLHAGGLPADHRLTVTREQSVLQSVSFVKGDKFPYDTVEKALDRSAMVAQDSKDRIDRTVHLPDSDPESITTELPPVAVRKSLYLGCDTDGNITEKTVPIGSVTPSALGAQLILRTLANQMRDDLNIESDTYANRPVTRVNGDIFIATDTQQLFIWDSGWKEVGVPQIPVAYNFVRNPLFTHSHSFFFDTDCNEGDQFGDFSYGCGDLAAANGCGVGAHLLMPTYPNIGPLWGYFGRDVANVDKKIGIYQVIGYSASRKLAGQTISASGYLKGDTPRMRAAVIEFTTTGAFPAAPFSAWNGEGVTPTPAANINILGETAQLDPSAPVKFELPNLSVSASMKQLAIIVWTDDGTTADTSGGDNYYVTELQVELGATVTPFRPVTPELSRQAALGEDIRLRGGTDEGFEISGWANAISNTLTVPIVLPNCFEDYNNTTTVSEVGSFTKTNCTVALSMLNEGILQIRLTALAQGQMLYKPDTDEDYILIKTPDKA
jgi:hypothetical protein